MNNISMNREELDQLRKDEQILEDAIQIGVGNYTNPFSKIMALVRLIAVGVAYIALISIRKKKLELRLNLWEFDKHSSTQQGVDTI